MREDSPIQHEDRVWRNSRSICALADRERHLGHVLKVGRQWYAFDGTHLNDESNGFRTLGSFASLSGAKDAVAQSVTAAGVHSGSAVCYSNSASA